MCLSDCSKCKYLDRNPHHSSDILCSLEPAYAAMWKRLKSLDEYSLNCLPVDDCQEFELDPIFEEKTIALSLNFFDWQKLERSTSNSTIGKALKDTIIELNLALTCENWQAIANSTLIPNVSAALEAEGFKPHQDPWIDVDSSCIDAIAYLQTESALKIRFNSGCIYQYENVSHNAFVNFLHADSKGRFFNRNIKDAYPYRLL